MEFIDIGRQCLIGVTYGSLFGIFQLRRSSWKTVFWTSFFVLFSAFSLILFDPYVLGMVSFTELSGLSVGAALIGAVITVPLLRSDLRRQDKERDL